MLSVVREDRSGPDEKWKPVQPDRSEPGLNSLFLVYERACELPAGNTVIIKPSEITSHASGAMAGLINEHFDRSLFHVVEGGAEAGSQLIGQGVDKIFFTGSSRVGRLVMEAAAGHLTPVTLELGGKNPVIVMEDCHLKRTARRLVWGKFHNNGAACVAPDHVYVHESVREELIREIGRQIREIHGENPGESMILPRLINGEHYDRLMALIETQKVVAGGKCDRAMLYIEPTVLDGVEPGDPIMKEEVFGPLLPLLSYRHLDELLQRLKKQPSPLAVYVFSGNTARAKRIVRDLPCGGGMVNEVVLHFINMNTPFGGFGESGMGSYHGRAGFDAFSHYKTILHKPFWFELFLKYPPYRNIRLRIIRSVLGQSVRSFFH